MPFDSKVPGVTILGKVKPEHAAEILTPEALHNEITGPVDRKMVINALNSGAATFMADFE
ncbi:hypothetical protein BGZ79_006191, partial [Entomortierella chlamydospora]